MPALCMAEDTFFFGFGREEDKTLMNNRLTVTGSVVPYDAHRSEWVWASM